ncbi:hypothetical protein PAPYR_13193 [Paratrimastix pyriformis]|uniref:Uncharacterized protein n=1 Tax=Paratrimastix pyriformis TaxID=342808 RepID=A0ABQ8U0N0_9EUKA|nr:hypothetical protein PAPYR_13193 [Paratrimastix pyriformis]
MPRRAIVHRPGKCNIADFLSRAFPTTPHLTTLPAAPEPTQPTLRCCAISTPTVPLPYDIDDNGIIHLHDTPPLTSSHRSSPLPTATPCRPHGRKTHH